VAAMGLASLAISWSDARERLVHDGALALLLLGALGWRSAVAPQGNPQWKFVLIELGFGVVEGLVIGLALWGVAAVVGRVKARQMGQSEAVEALGSGDPPVLAAVAIAFGFGAPLMTMILASCFGIIGWAIWHRRHPPGHIPLVTYFVLGAVVWLIVSSLWHPASESVQNLVAVWSPLWPATLR